MSGERTETDATLGPCVEVEPTIHVPWREPLEWRIRRHGNIWGDTTDLHREIAALSLGGYGADEDLLDDVVAKTKLAFRVEGEIAHITLEYA